MIEEQTKQEKITNYFQAFLKLPWADESIPGSIVEQIIALTHEAQVLNTYDFVDVYIPGGVGWQVKSTKSSTPVTWKRAKIENKNEMIEHSRSGEDGLQKLGDSIIDFCNHHAHESIKSYGLKEIRYSRAILFENKSIKYFERRLCTFSDQDVFKKSDYNWSWSKEKSTQKKEQLSALHGFSKKSGKKVWAWHGLGENQLHFSGESEWWNDPENLMSFQIGFPTKKLSFDRFFELMSD
jgi:hypothetical protein